MSQLKWIRGPVCGIDNCRSRLYRRDAGRKFCQFGHVAEGNLDFEDEDSGSYSQTKRLNIQLTDTGFGSQAFSTAASASSISNSKSKERYHGEEGVVFSYKCLQLVLRDIMPKVLRYLYKDLGEDALNSLITSMEPIVKLFWIRCVKKTFARVIPAVVDLYAIIYLALRQLNRYPVFLDEYLEMLSKNKVPFVNAMEILPVNMRNVLPISAVQCFTMIYVPHSDYFYSFIAKWTANLALLGVRITPVDYSYPIVFKLLTDLRIPHAPQLLVIYHTLVTTITDGVFQQQGWYSPQTVPEVQIIAWIYYVIRLYLLTSAEIFDTAQWIEWLSRDEELPCFSNRIHHMTAEEILNLSSEQVSNYLDWVHDNVVSGSYRDPEGEGLSIMEKKLSKIFTFVKSDPPPKTRETSQPFEVVKNNLSPTDMAQVDAHLEKFICTRYGVKPTTLSNWFEKIERILYNKFS
ncbi:hypothetical protein JCM33374_g778 [Metschnikowia sp. JCM 33374]|nr:hypothetical protein JCM33374_g778 [Metschnikowia sp. JCM 33374]